MVTLNSMKHLSILCDGNRRWALKNGLPKELGHTHGTAAVERAVEWALNNHIEHLSLYVFSTENWRREQSEIDHLFDLARWYFATRKEWYIEHDVRVRFLGRRDRIPADVADITNETERLTEHCSSLNLYMAIDYGGRDEIVRLTQEGGLDEKALTKKFEAICPDPDLIVRFSGRHRLSNFMLWRAAYSELYFTDTLFPDLTSDELDRIMEWYNNQQRTFGF